MSASRRCERSEAERAEGAGESGRPVGPWDGGRLTGTHLAVIPGPEWRDSAAGTSIVLVGLPRESLIPNGHRSVGSLTEVAPS